MSVLKQVRRRHAPRLVIEQQLAQQKEQFGYLGMSLRNLQEFLQTCTPHPPTRQEPATTKRSVGKAKGRSGRRRRSAPAPAPGYVHLLSELREQAHEQRVDNTLEKLLQRQERHRHLVRNARPLVANRSRRSYVWRADRHRPPGIAYHYRQDQLRPSLTFSVWARLEACYANVSGALVGAANQSYRKPHKNPAGSPASRGEGEDPVSSLDTERAADVSGPAATTASWLTAPNAPNLLALPSGAIRSDVQRRWLQDEIRTLDLVARELHVDLRPDIRAFLEAQPLTPLWPHQVDAMMYMLSREGHQRFGSRGGINGDEMGLGKTRLMLEIVWRTRQLQLVRNPHQRHYRPTLLIVPNSISYHPARELKRAYPPNMLRVIRLCEGENLGASAADITAHVDLIVTTYPTIQRAYDVCFRGGHGAHGTGYEVLFDLEYERVIADEGHVFANPTTIVNKAAMALSARATHNWFFSGTPIQNRFSDIDAALRFIGIAEEHIPRVPIVSVHAKNLLQIQRHLEAMRLSLRSKQDRAEFRELWHVLTGQTTPMVTRAYGDGRGSNPSDDGGGVDDSDEDDDEEGGGALLSLLAEAADDLEEQEEEEAERPRKRARSSMIQITQQGVRHFLELYRCRRVMRVGQDEPDGIDALVERTIAEVYRSLESVGGSELQAYTKKLEELLRTCMLRRTRAQVGTNFGRIIRPNALVKVALPGGQSEMMQADAEGFLGPRYLRTHALFSRESDPFSEQLRFYERSTSESLLYAFYDAQRIELMFKPNDPNIFEHDVTAQGPFDPKRYECAQPALERSAIVAAYRTQRGDAVSDLDRQVCRIYERHTGVHKRTRARKHARTERRTLVAQRGMMAICSQLGTCKRVFLPPFLDPPDASASPAALFTQRTEYQRLTRLTPSVLKYCQAAARELQLGGLDGPGDALWRSRRRLALPTESTQFQEVKNMLHGMRPGEKMIVPFNSVETLLQLYFYIREWFPCEGEPGYDAAMHRHIQPLVLVGDMDAAARREAMERFESDPSYNVLLASMQVTSLGHNLDMANLVLAPDANYNPQHLRQATFRTARPGQQRRILLRVLIPKGTMIEHALLIGHEKMSMEEATIGGERASSRAAARSRRGASRIPNFVDAFKMNELDQLTRVSG